MLEKLITKIEMGHYKESEEKTTLDIINKTEHGVEATEHKQRQK